MTKALLPVILLLAAGAWWLIASTGGGDDSPLGQSLPETVLQKTEEIEAVEAAPVSGALPREASVDREEVVSNSGAQASAQSDVDLTGPRILVIDGGDENPVAGVIIWFLDSAKHRATSSKPITRKSLRENPVTVAKQFGIALRTNAEGIVRLPEFAKSVVVVADGSEGIGAVRVQPTDTAPVLTLWPRAALRIEVVDHSGQALADVPVALAVQMNEGWRTWWTGTTAGPHGQILVDSPRVAASLLGWDREDAKPCVAIVNLPFMERPSVEFDPASLPSTPIRLVLPPTGSVEVILEHPSPKALENANVGLEQVGFDWRETPGSSGTYRDVVDGRAVFDRVGVGFDLRVTALLAGSDLRHREVFKEPRLAGQLTTLRVSMVAKVPVIVVKIVTPDGDVLANTKLSAKLKAQNKGSTTTSSFSIETNRDGYLRIALKDDLGKKAVRHLALQGNGEGGRSGALSIPKTLRIGDNDLGDLVLRGQPRVCAGVVVDREGKPVVGASVRLLKKVDFPLGRARFQRTDVSPVLSGQEGRFTVRASVAGATEMALHVTMSGFSPAKQFLFAVGDANLRVVLAKAGSIAGSLLVDSSLPLTGIQLHLRLGTDGPPDTHRVASGGKFEFEPLKPGSYAFSVTAFGLTRSLFEVDGLVVRSGETLRDERLQNIDVRSGLRRLKFKVVDNAGAAVEGTVAMILPDSPDAVSGGGVFVDDGKGEVLATREPVGLWVYAPGYRATEVPDLRDGQEIVLDPVLKLRLQVPADVLAAAAPLHLFGSIVPTKKSRYAGHQTIEIRGTNRTSTSSGGLPWDEAADGRVNASGLLILSVMEPGEYLLTWQLGKSLNETETIETGEDRRLLVVRDEAGEQLFYPRIDLAQVEAARKK